MNFISYGVLWNCITVCHDVCFRGEGLAEDTREAKSKSVLEHHGQFSMPAMEEKTELQERWAATGDKAM